MTDQMQLNDRFEQAFIGLGSNLEDPVAQLDAGIGWLQSEAHISLLAVSGYYLSKPIGGPDHQPDFVNAVAEISTRLKPEALLRALQGIELRQHRIREEHWGPRTLDLDILLYGDAEISQPELTIPHPRMTDRAFVLQPLADLAPDLVIAGQSLDIWLEQVSDQAIDPL
ncbi:MAG: 2-amino-4-hydroxy-6-hydroxymethyldihydropteridine diphosphokinase [Natronospirillum sp.]|uniref:2-amino-4-hydroxy-6- hydroxymethyldihydropteridine diphosphokinase n=1 Tax=Natronospirillum sp. TaxID=2812955 RepID=UPI0025CF2237|nr:2-amino-4-hydroxy-6-hydroxymethyldihydropteridine diphosphokinase [Natronospirillum sp.]MCH8553236.1 2-amino-4-hydroxy-6-hydroxymethyldihydropteridine diphosphokinase [Natronospirillum sp.]